MRTAPSIQIEAELRGGWWLAAGGLWLLAAAAWAGALVWHIRLEGLPETGAGLLLWSVVCLGGLAALSAAGTAMWHARRHPVRLCWNGSEWRCTLPGQAEVDDGLPGQVDTVIDVGDAMLLCWASEPGGDAPRRRVWLPVARSTQGPAWHGLRVALAQPIAMTEGPLT